MALTLTTLVTGGHAADREAAIAEALDPSIDTALILEGLPSGTSSLAVIPDLPSVVIARVAPGCMCCTGNLTMRVTLNRILRKRPMRLYIGLANAAHLEQIRHFLTQTPYDSFLELTKDIDIGNR
ncbi:MAG TPA: GTPase [Noviherbaspirillum sp.]|uniref:GTPase n=1 Tax=Noviherbaspirillum sp. TaxID=1926288 RepID=UPI002DDCE303|nr:GTPase [Noviherbaspirillum sp.]HEV2609333.1 GTPase [Noviherbaspirillum sp.]